MNGDGVYNSHKENKRRLDDSSGASSRGVNRITRSRWVRKARFKKAFKSSGVMNSVNSPPH